MIKKIYAKLGTGMTFQSLRWVFTPRTYLLESQQQHTDSVPAVSTVAEARPEFTCFCPACDYDQAKATKDPEADFYHVTCSICSLDRDFDSVEKS